MKINSNNDYLHKHLYRIVIMIMIMIICINIYNILNMHIFKTKFGIVE